MKCNQCADKICDNEDMAKCSTCIAPMWCLCQRKGVKQNRDKLWDSATAEKLEAETHPPTHATSSPSAHG